MGKPVKVDARSTRDKISTEAMQCFADLGYNGVSMRDIARAAGITPAAIYHHFPDKDALYLASVKQAFNANTALFSLNADVESDLTPEQQFRQLVLDVINAMHSDPMFRRIYMREILDGDETRLRLLAEQVLADMHFKVAELMRQLAPAIDSHLVMTSLAGLVLHHLETIKIARFLPHGSPGHEDPALHAEHIADLMLYGILK